MRFRTILRTHSAVWSSPVLFFVAWRFVAAQSAPEAGPYPLPTTSMSLWAVAFIGPLSSATASWEAGRLRRGGVFALPIARRRWELLLVAVGPTLAVAAVAISISHTARMQIAGAWVAPEPRLLAVASAVVLSQAAFGFAAGTRLPSPLAVPLALIAPFLWMVGTAAVDPVWVRHLSGTWGNCCRLHEEIAPGALLAPLLFAASVLFSSLCSLRQEFDSRPVGILPLLLVPVAAGWLATPLVNDLESAPVIPRSRNELVCGGGNVPLCVWPENAGRLPALGAIVDQALISWRGDGVVVPTGVTEQRSGELPAGYRSLRIAANSRDQDVIASLADATLGSPPSCPDVPGRPAHLGGRIYPVLLAYLSLAAGVNVSELDMRFAPRDLEAARTALDLSPVERRAWVTDALMAWSTCDSPGPLGSGSG
jgi:hypothetical protein